MNHIDDHCISMPCLSEMADRVLRRRTVQINICSSFNDKGAFLNNLTIGKCFINSHGSICISSDLIRSVSSWLSWSLWGWIHPISIKKILGLDEFYFELNFSWGIEYSAGLIHLESHCQRWFVIDSHSCHLSILGYRVLLTISNKVIPMDMSSAMDDF